MNKTNTINRSSFKLEHDGGLGIDTVPVLCDYMKDKGITINLITNELIWPENMHGLDVALAIASLDSETDIVITLTE